MRFTPYEKACQITERIVQGGTLRQIRDELGVAKNTVMRYQKQTIETYRKVEFGEADAAAILARGPAYMGDTRFDNIHWSDQQKKELQILCEAQADIEKAASALGRGVKATAWRARDSGLALPPAWAAIIVKHRQIPGRRLQLAYPYIIRARDEHADLLAVNSLVPTYLPSREDICQEIMLALWEKRITLDQLKASRSNIRMFVTSFRRDNWEASGYAVSLDQPMHDGRSWHDVLAAPDATTL
jgi:hypothetical protein